MKYGKRAKSQLVRELEARKVYLARLATQEDLNSKIEYDRIAKDVAYIKLALEIWG